MGSTDPLTLWWVECWMGIGSLLIPDILWLGVHSTLRPHRSAVHAGARTAVQEYMYIYVCVSGSKRKRHAQLCACIGLCRGRKRKRVPPRVVSLFEPPTKGGDGLDLWGWYPQTSSSTGRRRSAGPLSYELMLLRRHRWRAVPRVATPHIATKMVAAPSATAVRRAAARRASAQRRGVCVWSQPGMCVESALNE